MLFIIVLITFLFVFCSFEKFRYTCFHLPTVSYNAILDIYKYFRFKGFNSCKDYGKMEVYIADESQPFGSGKTLNMIRSARSFYQVYNDKEVFDFDQMCFVNQYVHIYSNIKIYGIPYVPLKNTQQLIDVVQDNVIPDDDINKHIFVFLFDELGSLFNNRNWKENLSADFFNALMQQRKQKVLIMGTVQDFSLFDATMRKICADVYVCSKRWRFLTIRKYAASDIERAGFNPTLLQCRGLSVRFATDALYNSYDTEEMVQGIAKGVVAGEYISNKEILENSVNNADIRTLTRVQKKLRHHVRG